MRASAENAIKRHVADLMRLAGLQEGVVIASMLSLILLGGRFHWLTARDKHTLSV